MKAYQADIAKFETTDTQIFGLSVDSVPANKIMGFNYEICGFENVDDFYAAMQVSEGEHLKAFCGFIKSNSLDVALRNHQWAKLAAGYNGPSYKDNKYDEKLAAAFVKYSK